MHFYIHIEKHSDSTDIKSIYSSLEDETQSWHIKYSRARFRTGRTET